MAATSRWYLQYQPSSSSSSNAVLDPPGHSALSKTAGKNSTVAMKHPDLANLRQQKAWECALAPAKNVPMQAFMMYMSGASVQIFSIMSVWGCLKGAIGGILGVEKVFTPFTGPANQALGSPSLLLQKLTFLACQLGLLAVGCWKLNQLGLLPTHESDWLAFVPAPVWSDATSVSTGQWSGLEAWR